MHGHAGMIPINGSAVSLGDRWRSFQAYIRLDGGSLCSGPVRSTALGGDSFLRVLPRNRFLASLPAIRTATAVLGMDWSPIFGIQCLPRCKHGRRPKLFTVSITRVPI